MSSANDTEYTPVYGLIDFDNTGKSIISPINGLIEFDEKGKAIIIEVKLEQKLEPQFSFNFEPIIIENKENNSYLYACSICNKSFARKDYCKRHMLSHENGNTFDCQMCNKKFTHKYHLTQHMNFHKEIRDYECNICSFTAKFKFNLVKHKKTHIRYYDSITDTYKYL